MWYNTDMPGKSARMDVSKDPSSVWRTAGVFALLGAGAAPQIGALVMQLPAI